MKVLAFLLFVLACASASNIVEMEETVTESMLTFSKRVTTIQPGENKFTVQRPEGTRTYYAYFPKAYFNSQDAVPLVFSFHGLGDTCLNFGHATGLADVAENNNFIFVYPCGSDGLLGTGWNAGTCCLRGSNIDDVAFTRAMVTDLSQVARVNASAIFVSGFSNGAFMAEILSCQAPDIFRAAASVGGVVEMLPGNSAGLDKCTEAYSAFKQRTAVLNIHGTLDVVVPFTGDAILGFPPIPDDIAAWAKRNNCQGSPVQTFSNGTFSNSIYKSCDQGVQVELVKNEGGSHAWPINKYFDTTQYVWEFFKRFL